MKKKILNDIKIVIILLIGVIILFAILGSFQLLPEVNLLNKEGMSNVSDDNAPPCYSSIQDDEWAIYSEDEDKNNYILKTKIVPPKGTACPTEISSPASNYLDNITSSSNSNNITSSSNNITSSSNSDTSTTTNTNISTNTPYTPTSSNITENGSNTSSNTSTFNTMPNTLYNTNTNTNSIESKNEKSGSCPPCPACERCPEPAFDCKKVPNYRSPSIGQYLPMPILNDFSTF
jgi:hypothetical protein